MEDGIDIVDPEPIQQKFFDFYSGLFGTVLNDIDFVDINVINLGPIIIVGSCFYVGGY